MTTVIFIHGTGVRPPHTEALNARVTASLAEAAPGVRVVPLDWGEPYGARLAAGGASIPPDGAGATERDVASEEDDEAAVWERLYRDPEAELALAATRGTSGAIPPGAAFADEEFRERLAALAARDGSVAPELGPGLGARAAALARSTLLSPAAEALDREELAPLLARALAAAVIGAALAEDAPVLCDGTTRDAAVDRIARELGATEPGSTRGPVGRLIGRPVLRLGSRYAVRRRRALTGAVHPAAGDVLTFLVRGGPLRTALRGLVAAVEPPVVLLGHSLGGIIALDTLIEAPLPGVRLLVTVGSQGPFLYETGALPHLDHPEPLPAHVPGWLNIHDRRDLLGFAAAPVFPGRAEDIVTDNRQPFPVAHSAYWSDPAVYRAIAERLP
ncbi:alpha/beta fold hydrolase [Streptomyces rubiginosohelvolus]|uniref:alpha/beta fold hydrolase n=1 Tax=Streptomyces rubiginosohelvolus TaxID=67362 RepID=UPI0036DACD4F